MEGCVMASARSWTARRAVSAEENFGTGKLWVNNSIVLIISTERVSGTYTV